MQRTRTGKFRAQPRDPLTNRRISITGETPTAVAARVQRVQEVRRDLNLGADPEEAARKLRVASGRLLTLGDVWARYLKTKPERKRLKADEIWRRYIAPHLGPETRVWQLTAERLAAWMVELEEAGAHALSTRAGAYDFLAAAVHLLVPTEIAVDPWGRWRPDRPRRDQFADSAAAARSVEELDRLLGAALRHDAENRSWSYVAIAVIVDVACGARAGELAGLSWDAVDLDGDPPMLHLRYQAPRDWRRWSKGGRPSLLRKGGRSVSVRLPEIAVAALRIQRAELSRRGYYRSDGPVFPGVNGEWRTSGAVIKPALLREFAREARLPDWRHWRPHALRHTLGTLGLKNTGGDLRAIQAILGHSDLAVTMRYSHLAGRALPAPAIPTVGVELPEAPRVELVEREPLRLRAPAAGEDELCLPFPTLARQWIAHPVKGRPRPPQVTRAADMAYRQAWGRARYDGAPPAQARALARQARGRVLGAWGRALSVTRAELGAPADTTGNAEHPQV